MERGSEAKDSIQESNSTEGTESSRDNLLIVVAAALALAALILIKLTLNSRGRDGVELESAIEEVAELIKSS